MPTFRFNFATLALTLSVATGHAAPRPKLPSRSTNIALFRNDQRLLVVNRETDSLSVFAVRKQGADVQRKIAEVTVGREPRCVAVGAKGREAYVVNAASGTVSVVALAGAEIANTVVAEIEVGSDLRGCAVTPNGKTLFVADYTAGEVVVIDAKARQVRSRIAVGGNPWALAITNDGDRDDGDETVFVSQFFAETIPGGPGEGFDDGKRGLVQSFGSGSGQPLERITLSPLADSGFDADRKLFCRHLTATAHSDLFCPDTTLPATDPAIAKDVQGAYPNQLHALLVRGGQVIVPSIGASPEPPVKFNVNVQALVHVIDASTRRELADRTINLNAQIKEEAQPNPAEGSVQRLFANDVVALDGTADGRTVLFVSRGGNVVLRADRDGNGNLAIGLQEVIRFRTGNIPTGIVVSADGRRAYVNNEVGLSVSVLDLATATVLVRDLPSATVPTPGSLEHARLVGKLVFHTALGTPNEGLAGTFVRDIDPVDFRNKASDNGWSSCASCHPDGLADGVTWIFGTGPRQTLPLDAFFSKRNPANQRISNYSGVMGSVTDFNNNSRNVQGGTGFVDDPTQVFQHGFTQGVSEALDMETVWVQSIRPLNRPQVGDLATGRTVFETACSSCHGGDKWTSSETLYRNDPTFTSNPNTGGVPLDTGVQHTGAQVTGYRVGGQAISFFQDAGTFDATAPIEMRSDGTTALGGLGYNVPSLLGIGHHGPFFHDGSAPTLKEAVDQHRLPGSGVQGLSAAERQALIDFVAAIDGRTPPLFGGADAFRASLAP